TPGSRFKSAVATSGPSCGTGKTGTAASIVFFFQAEDGIRDRTVTGVQTCALPISPHLRGAGRPAALPLPLPRRPQHAALRLRRRSEERRVGKECRAGWSRKD